MCILRLWRRRLAKTSAAISLLQPVSFCISHGRQALWKLVAECFQVARSVHPIHDSSGPFRPLRLSFLPRHDARLLRTHSFSEESDGGFVQEKIRHVRGLHSGIWAPICLHAGLLHGILEATNYQATGRVHARSAVGEHRTGQAGRKTEHPTKQAGQTHHELSKTSTVELPIVGHHFNVCAAT